MGGLVKTVCDKTSDAEYTAIAVRRCRNSAMLERVPHKHTASGLPDDDEMPQASTSRSNACCCQPCRSNPTSHISALPDTLLSLSFRPTSSVHDNNFLRALSASQPEKPASVQVQCDISSAKGGHPRKDRMAVVTMCGRKSSSGFGCIGNG